MTLYAGVHVLKNCSLVFVTSANGLFVYVNDCILKKSHGFDHGEKIPVRFVQLLERWLTIVEFTQAFVEMTASRIGGRGARWAVIVVISLIKACMRLVLLYAFKSNIQTHPPVKKMTRETLFSKDQDVNSNNIENKSKPYVYVGRRTGHVMRTLDHTSPTHSRSWETPKPSSVSFELEGKVVNSSFPTPPGSPTELNNLERVGETLHILRPIIHLIGVGFFGTQSVVPWLASLVTDASSHTLLNGHVQEKLKTSTRFNSDERKELRRRAAVMIFYLLRSPIYDRFTKVKVMKMIQVLSDHVPLVRFILQPLARYLPAWQQVYFYTWKE
uniref:peroxisomal membrane protein PEX16-like n=1 Tax=Styela clava TaxID=7725 RepID=UPI001939E83B|nr:peroxisomal membrane protein PEX16-like [Styela clava]